MSQEKKISRRSELFQSFLLMGDGGDLLSVLPHYADQVILNWLRVTFLGEVETAIKFCFADVTLSTSDSILGWLSFFFKHLSQSHLFVGDFLWFLSALRFYEF